MIFTQLRFFLILFLFSFLLLNLLHAEQHSPESNKDLRHGEKFFLIENSKDILILEKTSGNDFYLMLDVVDKKDSFKKIKLSSHDAKKMDEELLALFIEVQIEQLDQPDCRSEWSITMRKDNLKWCSKDQAKLEKLQKFWDKSKTLF